MSVKVLPRELGLIIRCDGEPASKGNPEPRGCEEKFQTANIRSKKTRAWLKTQGWSRGLRDGHKRKDHCPKHAPMAAELFAKEKSDREAKKRERDAARIARFAGAAPKKSKKPKAAPSAETSPSADSAQAPA